ncbi:MAG TPA: 4Fe-4S dicluster domain-containing protein [Bacteroidales bacterium]|nr:4Fe-4S dicluster domain-containing protein [Bacteroidales bacterium]HPJ58307.1 4Fe-4S dicluster domain-containing protein [Bacteroidales bacterium]HRW84153.1 4Fe-4S dicluster domain-containing protein [Bacteroidales bacterium]
MSKSILIDLMKLRSIMADDPSIELPEALFYPKRNENGLKTIRELAVFRFTCRKCEDAPCIAACPADALEKDSDGIINRHTNLCVSCKSCVTICPFGTMMTDFFKHHRNRDILYDLASTEQMEKFAAACPPGTVTITDTHESPVDNIYRLNNKVLVKDLLYKTD